MSHLAPHASRQREKPRAYAMFESFLSAKKTSRGLYAQKAADSAPAELRIYDTIGEDFWTGGGITAEMIAQHLDSVSGAKALNIFINSPGGNVWEGKTIVAQLQRFQAFKTVYVDGIAASAASLIAMAGDKIITEAAGTWFLHRVMGGAWGYAEDLRKMADDIDVETKAVLSIYVSRTGKSEAEILKLMDAETYIGAEDALRLGITDEIAKREPQIDPETPDEPTEPDNRVKPRARTVEEMLATARADFAALTRASPGNHTGQPVNPQKPANRQEQHK